MALVSGGSGSGRERFRSVVWLVGNNKWNQAPQSPHNQYKNCLLSVYHVLYPIIVITATVVVFSHAEKQ